MCINTYMILCSGTIYEHYLPARCAYGCVMLVGLEPSLVHCLISCIDMIAWVLVCWNKHKDWLRHLNGIQNSVGVSLPLELNVCVWVGFIPWPTKQQQQPLSFSHFLQTHTTHSLKLSHKSLFIHLFSLRFQPRNGVGNA